MLEIDVATKEPQVIAALCHLEDFLGEDSVVLMDYRDGDRLAVGVANPAIHGVLAYIASVAWGSYEIHIECLPPPDSDPSFNTIAILRQCNELALMGQIVGSALQVSNDCPCIVDSVAAWLLPDAANVRHYPAVIERGVSGFGVFFPDILGCTSFGDTVAQAYNRDELVEMRCP